MIRAVIIDDENTSRVVLRKKLEDGFNGEINIVGEANDIESGEKIIQETKPDLVFLDIKMKNGTGFDLLKRIKEINFEVIFITAYDNFAIKAFEFSAFGYLLKPVKTSDLRSTIDRLKYEKEKLKSSANQRARVLLENYGNETGKVKKLVVNNLDGFEVIDLEKIIRLRAESNYTHFILTDKRKVTISRTLGEYEKLLDEHGFYRIHQSHIVNLRHVTGYVKADRGQVKMCDGELLQISRERKDGFILRFV